MDLAIRMVAYLKHQELWYCALSYSSWPAHFISFSESTLWRTSAWLSIGYIITESLNAPAIYTRKATGLTSKIARSITITSIRVMHWWIQRATTDQTNESPVSRVRNPTRAIMPPIKGMFSVKRILTWKSLARKIKKTRILSMLRINMNKSLKRKRTKKVLRRRKKSNRSKTSRFNSKWWIGRVRRSRKRIPKNWPTPRNSSRILSTRAANLWASLRIRVWMFPSKPLTRLSSTKNNSSSSKQKEPKYNRKNKTRATSVRIIWLGPVIPTLQS